MSNYALRDLHVPVMLHTIARQICKLTNAVTFVWTKSESVSKVIRWPLCTYDVELADVIRKKVGKIWGSVQGEIISLLKQYVSKKGTFLIFGLLLTPRDLKRSKQTRGRGRQNEPHRLYRSRELTSIASSRISGTSLMRACGFHLDDIPPASSWKRGQGKRDGEKNKGSDRTDFSPSASTYTSTPAPDVPR